MTEIFQTAEEVAALKPGQRDALMRWPVKSGDDTVIYYPGVVGETRVLGIKEKEPDFEDSSFTEAEKDTLKKLFHGTFTKRSAELVKMSEPTSYIIHSTK